ncbi:MAG: ABC transporter ATP-binding protein [Thermoleophilaceae bacterium]|nr:ABC transporter ATP-binding protein [Thermoleophilaceae bacterium]
MSVIRSEGLTKSFGEKRAVAGVDLLVEGGVVCALLGPSGCGKTTMLRLIAGFERPDAGRVLVGDRVVAGDGAFVAPERRRIGMVFQDYALFPHLSVEANVAYALGRSPDRSRISEVLALVGLEGLGERQPHELSGGEQQRVALARALAPTPEVILLDEPFSNLDAALRVRVRREMRDILVAAGVTALFVTHDQEEALSLADRVAVMREGAIEQEGTPEEVYGRPRSRWVADFLGDAEIVPGTAAGGAVECELGRFPIPKELEGVVDVVVRPESVALGAGAAPGRDRSHEGVVVAREYYGHDQLVEVELHSGLRLRSRSMGFPIWHPGDRVRVWIDGPVNALAAERAGVAETAGAGEPAGAQ